MADKILPETQRLQEIALDYHETVEGEYGCPGLSCPGVQRLVKLLESAQPQWQAMETAPQETMVLVVEPKYANFVGHEHRQAAFFSSVFQRWMTEGLQDVEPTAWMPLPDPPKGPHR